MGAAYTPDEWDEWTDRMKAAHGNGNGHGKSLAIEAQRLLPTPTTADHKASGARGYGGNEFSTLTDATVRNPQDWRQYEAAIRRAETATGRPAPPPTETGTKGTPRLSPGFVEWLMMLPAGHVTDPAIGLTRNEQLKALGNGVVPAQAAAALRAYLADEAVAA